MSHPSNPTAHGRRRVALAVLLAIAAFPAACSDAPNSQSAAGDIRFERPGSLSQASGRGSFRFGAASAATQIEDQNHATDWYLFTEPKEQGGLGHGPFVGEAAHGYTLALDDVDQIARLHLDAYRFSIEWARVEPERNHIDESALEHYSQVIDALVAAGIRPMVTIHHFSNPLWIDDPRDPGCASGPSDANLCGLGHPIGGPQVIAEMAEHARLLASRFGDRVDEWGTLNEPVNYLVAAYGLGTYPPGKTKLFQFLDQFVPVIRDALSAHAAMTRAIKSADTIDADGDGVAAEVGLTLSVVDWVPARDGHESSDPADVAARDRLVYAFHHLAVDSLENGTFDANLDGTPDEQHPEWKNTLDWLGLQYYFRAGVTAANPLVPVLNLAPCFDAFDFGACVPPTDPTYCVPVMGYEFYAPGLFEILQDFGSRYPSLPLAVTESGIATEVGERRAENVVRTLEQIERARRAGVDVRGYYHWSLYDNFEWTLGFVPRFGLLHVDYSTYERTPTLGADVLAAIAGAHRLTAEQRRLYGGDGPLTPEPGAPANPRTCSRADLGG